jgi:hypothetical protein
MIPAHKAGEPQQVSRIVEAVAEVGSECYARCAVLEAALVELVNLKDLKDSIPEDAGEWSNDEATRYREYIKRKPAAWKAARAALTSATRSQA